MAVPSSANILFTRELARQLAGTGVTANCLHPGFVATGSGAAFRRAVRHLRAVCHAVRGRDEEGPGRRRSCISPVRRRWPASVAPISLIAGRPEPSPAAQDDAAAKKRLWEESEKIAGFAS